MKQLDIGGVAFAGAPKAFDGTNSFVAMTMTSGNGRCALLLDLDEVRQMAEELEVEAIKAFGPDWRK